jgi:two-component system CheB/CheR fusion protein
MPLPAAQPASPGPADFLVVAIGASAGGLDACRKFLAALPAASGHAFILVQHLDPSHDSMLVDLLASHTALLVCQAEEGMPLAPGHLYVIPPGCYLSIADDVLHLSPPKAPHGARLPIDFLLHSLAKSRGGRAACLILSGTGGDGSAGLVSLHQAGGLVIAQNPAEAGYAGMPQAAILTGKVDHVLLAAAMPAALAAFARHDLPVAPAPPPALPKTGPETGCAAHLPAIIALIRARTRHDFAAYKTGTLLRRIARRMAVIGVAAADIDSYVAILQEDTEEVAQLAKDLLIHVTSFFRDKNVFDKLAAEIIPALIRNQPADLPIRLWVAGCSTGEEAYSLTILFLEAIDAAKSAAKTPVKLQVFASDIDPQAIGIAREGSYPAAIASDIAPHRLARFFVQRDGTYTVIPALRDMVTFTVQDVLADPPFSRLDMISCRNLLIYLQAEAQTNIVPMFAFALRDNGILLLGNSEVIADSDGPFELIAKSEGIYRHRGRARGGDMGFALTSLPMRVPGQGGKPQPVPRHIALADLCRQTVLENYAPASVLVNRKNECLYSLGPTDRYLRVAPGYHSNDLLAMARPRLRAKLRAAMQKAAQENTRITIAGDIVPGRRDSAELSVDVLPLLHGKEPLFLISFVELEQDRGGAGVAAGHDIATIGAASAGSDTLEPHIAALERELEETRSELQESLRNLEMSEEDQRAINEETLSANEEYQSTNEELMTSKEELQSLNEELIALNGQLRETLDRQNILSNDLRNVLNSSDMATIFLDLDFNIRLFTPAAKEIFTILPSDIGRPLADLSSLSTDTTRLDDARIVLKTQMPVERDIQTRGGAWFRRRILPYRTQDNNIEGIVITFTDTTLRRQTADALAEAKRRADNASMAKSRFLAAASHDLRQPLQTLALLQGQLAKAVEGDKAKKLVRRLDEMLGTMSGMLNSLLDINQIEAGTTTAAIGEISLNDLLTRLREEYDYAAQAQGLSLRVVPCSLWVRSDPRLLEQMIRNLLSNALKYTLSGRVLLGCRRLGSMATIEVWDTGIGIPAAEFDAIFDEYHQLDNPARQRSRGLGLGLAIVQRLGHLLGHHVHMKSRQGHGSGFMIDVPIVAIPARAGAGAGAGAGAILARCAHLLVIEDDAEIREALVQMLEDEGHRVSVAADGTSAVAAITNGRLRPDLILADFNLPGEMNGQQAIARARGLLKQKTPGIILTGDISIAALRDIALNHCLHLNKPVKLEDINQAIQRLLQEAGPEAGIVTPAPHSVRHQNMPPEPMPEPMPKAVPVPLPRAPGMSAPPPGALAFVVDDDISVRAAIAELLQQNGMAVQSYASGEDFLRAYVPGQEACLVLDAHLLGMSGFEVLHKIGTAGGWLQTIMITGQGDVATAVQAMQAGASDFIEKPVSGDDLLASITRALERAHDSTKRAAWHEQAAAQLKPLTSRQREIMTMVLAGHPSKNIAADLCISQRTVENHRAAIMQKANVKSIPALARLALAAGWGDDA